jgi:hypothetical protein
MTGGERSQVEDGRTRPDGPVKVIVVARDGTRQVQYEASLRVAATPALATADPDAGADLLVQHHPAVLVLDSGLPRLALFRLYGLAREEGPPAVQVVFVGQDDDTGPDDHYLPGDPSPSRVAVQVSTLISRLDEDADGEHDAPAAAPAVPPPATPIRPVQAAGSDDEPAAAVGPASASAAMTGAAATTAAASSTTVEQAPAADDEAAAAPARRPGRRLDVMLVRIGLVLLILGGLLFLLQMQMSQGPLVTPTLAPAAPPPRSSPSPSPARTGSLVLDAPAVAGAVVRAVAQG